MTCEACGNNIAANQQFCGVCGRAVPSPGPSVQDFQVPAKTSGKAIVSLVFGLFFFLVPFAIVAIVFGHLALSNIRKSAGRLKGQGIAIAGLVLGYLGIAAIPIILILAAIAIPNLLRARIAANEASAVAWVRILNNAENAYAQSHPNAGFTCNISDLQADQLISGELASGRNHGYAFELSGCVPDESGVVRKVHVIAYPVAQNQSGVRAFCSDESGIVKKDTEGSTQNCLRNGQPLE